MKKLLLAVLLFPLVAFSSVEAATPTILAPVSIPSQPNIVVTEFGGGMPDFIEIYNQASDPVLLSGKSIQISITGLDAANAAKTETHTIALPSGWLLSRQYAMIQRGTGSAPNVLYYQPTTLLTSIKLTSIMLDSSIITPFVNMAQNEWVQHKQRGSATLKMTGVFATDYGTVKTTPPTGNADTLYLPPHTSGGLRILEILPNGRACSPTESAYDCNDYIKLYNPTNIPINLDLYRLRSDSGGLKSSISNTFTLGGVLQPGEYALINAKGSGDPISLTNTGGYIWLEDVWGVKIYDDPVLYPDASADSKKGQSWAVDRSGTWQWMSPAPESENYWPPVTDVLVAQSATVVSLMPCRSDQERNPQTNRCRNIISVSTSLAPCKAGQERNVETNRCRSVLAVTTTLTPCKAGETRNAETNKCRKNTTTASSLAPCKVGYERNPETNRCRKPQSAVNTASIVDVKTSQLTNKRAWWLAGAIIVAALAYAIYEWRQDIWLRFRYHTKK